jgi:hypothetical protein
MRLSGDGRWGRPKGARSRHALRCYAALVFFSCAGRFRSHRPKRRLRPGRGIKLMSVTKHAAKTSSGGNAWLARCRLGY